MQGRGHGYLFKFIKEYRDYPIKCYMCGTFEDLTVHHIKPKAEGGMDFIENLSILCCKCHRKLHSPEENPRKVQKRFWDRIQEDIKIILEKENNE